MDKMETYKPVYGSIRVRGENPLSTTIQVDRVKLEFCLRWKSCRQELETELEGIFATVDWPSTASCVLDVRCTDPNKDADRWKRDVEVCISQFMEDISVRKVQTSEKDYAQSSIRRSNHCLLIENPVTHEVHLVGKSENVRNAAQIINDLKSLEESGIVIKLKPPEYFLLKSCHIEREIKRQCKDVEVKFEATESQICMKGPKEKLNEAKSVVANERYRIQERSLVDVDMSPEQFYLLSLDKTFNAVCNKIKESRCLCYLDNSMNGTIVLHAFTKQDLNKAETLIKTTLHEEHILIEGDPTASINPNEYGSIFRQIEGNFPGLVKLEYMPVEFAIKIVVVVDYLKNVLGDVNKFLSRSQVLEALDYFRPCVFKFMFKRCDNTIKKLREDHGIELIKNSKLSVIKLRGKNENIRRFREGIDTLLRHVVIRRQTISTNNMCLEKLHSACSLTETCFQCAVEMVNDSAHQTDENRTIVAMSGSLQSLDVDVIVVYVNQKLEPMFSKSKAVVKAAGKDVKQALKKTVAENGEMKEWSVVSTGAGSLKALALLHVVIPTKQIDPDYVSMKDAITQCFDLAEKQRFRSIAISSIGKMYSLAQQINTIIHTIQRYFINKNNSGIQTTVFCDSPESAIAFLEELKSTRTNLRWSLEGNIKNNMVSASTSANSEWKEELHIKDKDGFLMKIGDLDVTCCVGDITDDKVDAIVNGTNNQLDLRIGTVSQTILLQGGRALERELNSDEKRNEMKQSHLTVTSSGDPGNMSCMFIFHVDVHFVLTAHSPYSVWKKLIVKCLKKAEEMKIRSLAFPALGTGNMRVPMATTCRFFMEALWEFTKKKIQFLHDVHIVVLDHDVLTSLYTEIQSYHIDFGRLWCPTYYRVPRVDLFICADSTQAAEDAIRALNNIDSMSNNIPQKIDNENHNGDGYQND